MNSWKVYFVGLLSAFSDAATSWMCSQRPELKERNPLANPFLEAASVLGFQTVILHAGEKLKVNSKVATAIALVPAALPFAAAANNVVYLALVQAKEYPWRECPFLYPNGS